MVNNNIPIVDEWKPEKEDILFTNCKNWIIIPLSELFRLDNDQVDYFRVKLKKSYDSDKLRDHLCLYMNYFEKYFDIDKEYISIIYYLKANIDIYMQTYTFGNFLNDIRNHLLSNSIINKVIAMTEHNYSLHLQYKTNNNYQLKYTDEHAKILMDMSILMNICIPIIIHYADVMGIKNTQIDSYLLDIYDYILNLPQFSGVDIVGKLYATAISNVKNNAKNNMGVWSKQEIRGRDTVSHAEDAVRNIIINIMPKYAFSNNMISLNYTSIQKNNKYQVTDIGYEYNYIQLYSSKRDGEDNSSELDKYEMNITKASEAKYLQAKFNSEYNMSVINNLYGPFDTDEIKFYIKSLKNDSGELMNGFQRNLIFGLFFKQFGDTESIKSINIYDYIKLMISAKRILKSQMMIYLPYIISAKVEKIILRKTLNKREQVIMEHSQYYPMVVEKYKNDKISVAIQNVIATILTSTFRVIDYNNPDINGTIIRPESTIIIQEILLYILLI